MVEQPPYRLDKGIRRRTDSVGIFSNRDEIARLNGAVLAEQTDECAEGRRHLCLEILARCRLTTIFTMTTEPEIRVDTMPALTAQPGTGPRSATTLPAA